MILGIAARRQSEVPATVEVVRTVEGMPAHGTLQPGDLILAVGATPLGDENPLSDLRRLVRWRAGDPVIVLLVERQGRILEVAVSNMPSSATIKSLDSLARLVRLGKAFVSASIHWAPETDGRSRTVLGLRFWRS